MAGGPPERGGALGVGLGLLDSFVEKGDGQCQGHTVHRLFKLSAVYGQKRTRLGEGDHRKANGKMSDFCSTALKGQGRAGRLGGSVG